MISTRFQNPAEVILKKLLGAEKLTISTPERGPTYNRENRGRIVKEQCPRIDWTMPDGKRFCFFVEPILRTHVLPTVWPLPPKFEEREDFQKTMDLVIEQIEAQRTALPQGASRDE